MTEERLETIDVFRGIAILMVVLFHFTAGLPPDALNITGAAAPPVFFGWVGVYFFFAISGYCIYLTLEKSASVAVFLARRFSRIYPALLAAVVLLFIYGIVAPLPSVPALHFHERAPTLVDLALNLLLVGDGRWINGSFWSIAVEVKFYVLLGGMALFIPDRKKLAITFTWLSLAAAPFWIVAMLAANRTGDHLVEKLVGIVTIAPYLPFFAIGVLCRMRMLKAMPTTILLSLASIEAAAVIWLNAYDFFQALAPSLTSLAVLAILMLLLVRFADRRPLPRIAHLSEGIAKIGFISFSWYLIHENLGVGFLVNLDRFMPAPFAVVAALLMTLVIAYVFAVAVEWRFRKPFERLALVVLTRVEAAAARVRPATTGLTPGVEGPR